MAISYLADFVSLIYPECCAACGEGLVHSEKTICLTCLYDLPYSGFEKDPANPVAQQFWGRLPVRHALAVWLFDKGGSIQQLMHNLKYNGSKQTGILLGRLAGKIIAETSWFTPVDCIIPVPLHPAKYRKRGYNQSAFIAKGMADVLNVPVYDDVLIRQYDTGSQTKRSRYERYKNMKDRFFLAKPDRISAKHVLLVDDIMTTGATFEGCLSILNPSLSSVCAMAYTK